MPGYHPWNKTKRDSDPYAQNPYGPKNSYAGKGTGMTMLTDIEQTRDLTPKERSENKEIKSEYNKKKTLLTGSKEKDLKEKKELTKEKTSKKSKNSISQVYESHTVYV